MSDYAKRMNENMGKKYVNRMLMDLCNDVVNEISLSEQNMYDQVHKNIRVHNDSNIDMDEMLKFFLLKTILETKKKDSKMLDIEEQIKALHLSKTANNKIYKSIDDGYYKYESDKFCRYPEIIEVQNDGSYFCKEKVNYSVLAKITKYDINDELLNIKLIDRYNNVIKDKNIVAELLNLKKELENKYALIGYSGNSADILGRIFNTFSQKCETGYYIDRHLVYYRWNFREACFEVIRNLNIVNISPMLCDYEFKDNFVIITKYKGVA